MKPDDIQRFFPNEAALCALFIREFNEQPGWTCYPETGGFDVLVAHESGRQIGVEAKLRLNAKVADQILPNRCDELHGRHGPDHRLVIVDSITEANAGIARMLELFGIPVWAPRVHERWGLGESGRYVGAREAYFDLTQLLRHDADCAEPPRVGYHFHAALFDWNPPERVPLPDLRRAAVQPCAAVRLPAAWRRRGARGARAAAPVDAGHPAARPAGRGGGAAREGAGRAPARAAERRRGRTPAGCQLPGRLLHPARAARQRHDRAGVEESEPLPAGRGAGVIRRALYLLGGIIWPCRWWGCSRDWPEMERCGRCGAHMPLGGDA